METIKIEDYPNGWHKQVTKEHICIWSDKWLELHNKNLEKEKEEVMEFEPKLIYKPPEYLKYVDCPKVSEKFKLIEKLLTHKDVTKYSDKITTNLRITK